MKNPPGPWKMFDASARPCDVDQMGNGICDLSASGHSFVELCVPVRPELLKFALHLNKYSQAQADDLVQDVFIRAMRSWATWSPESPGREDVDPSIYARAWLFQIVANLHINRGRDEMQRLRLLEKRYPEVIAGLHGVEVEHRSQPTSSAREHEANAPVDSFGEVYGGKRTVTRTAVRYVSNSQGLVDPSRVSKEILVAIARLRPKWRALVERHYFEGQTSESIAADMGLTPSTVRGLLCRARAKMRPLLASFAREQYGFVDQHSAGRVDTTVQTSEMMESQTDGVDGIMAEDDTALFGSVDIAPDELSASSV